MLPIYWLLNMSFKTTNEILGGFTLWPHDFTLDNYVKIFTDPTWYNGYINSITYVVDQHGALGRRGAAGGLCLLALPLPRRQASVLLAPDQPHGAACRLRAALPAALFGGRPVRYAICAVALAHTLFNIPLAVWILEGFMSGVPKELDETAYVDGYSFWRLLHQDLHADDRRRHRRRRLLLLHVLLGRAAARQDADLGRGQAHRRRHDANRQHVGL